MSAAFELHPRLAADCFTLGDFPLCRLLMMNDAQYPWFIMVPRRPAVRELFELDDVDQQFLVRESAQLARTLMRVFRGDKLNLAALGNVVPQLHLHHIVRFIGDPAWPDPVWGRRPPRPYGDAERTDRVDALIPHLPPDFAPAPRP